VLVIFLLGNFQTSEIIPGWEREQSWKTPVWEQEHLPIFKYSGSGWGNFLENYGQGTGTQYEFSKISEELRAIAKSLFSPQKEIVFRARKSLITDIRAGARNSPFTFVSVYSEAFSYV
jgi:hypothetical protein